MIETGGMHGRDTNTGKREGEILFECRQLSRSILLPSQDKGAKIEPYQMQQLTGRVFIGKRYGVNKKRVRNESGKQVGGKGIPGRKGNTEFP